MIKEKTKNVLIRNFGNDTNCQSVEELKEALTNKYAGLSVSVVTSSGIGFVDVQKDGTLIDSYKQTSIAIDNLF